MSFSYAVFKERSWLTSGFLLSDSHQTTRIIILSDDCQTMSDKKIRQPPAFPHRRRCSIPGRIRLNHRVRDVYGCFPYPHHHRKYSFFYFSTIQFVQMFAPAPSKSLRLFSCAVALIYLPFTIVLLLYASIHAKLLFQSAALTLTTRQ